jgi:hypothetical protein
VPLPPGFALDTSSVSQIAQALAGLTPMEASGIIGSLKQRPGGKSIDWAAAVAAACETGSVQSEQVRAGQQYQGAGTEAAVAAKNGHGVLFNPSGSGIRIVVFDVWMANASGIAELYMATGDPIGFNVLATQNAKSDGTAAKASVHTGTNTGLAGGGGTRLDSVQFPINTTYHFNPQSDAIIVDLAPNSGIFIFDPTVNELIRVGFRFAELAQTANV